MFWIIDMALESKVKVKLYLKLVCISCNANYSDHFDGGWSYLPH